MHKTNMPGAVAQSEAPGMRTVAGSLRCGYENISTTILSLIQERQLSVTGERMGTKFW